MAKGKMKLPKMRIDRDIAQIVSENGLPDTVAALARWAYENGRLTAYRRLDAIYTWLIARPVRPPKGG